MAFAELDGIATRYELIGQGPPLLMFSPGGFDATIEKWSTLGIYAKVKPLDHLPRHFTCIVFDRRECGQSNGRVEAITWSDYVAQAKALLDHLDIGRAQLMGGCMGCCPVAAFAVAYPERVQSMVLYWPVGGAKYRISGQQRFAEHLQFVQAHGLAAVVALVQAEGKAFNADPRGGPWASVLKHDRAFAEDYVKRDVATYLATVMSVRDTLLDRDSTPGPNPEDLFKVEIPALIVPGNDASHATSAARFLQECLPRSEYWDAPVVEQTEEATAARLLEFLQRTSA